MEFARTRLLSRLSLVLAVILVSVAQQLILVHEFIVNWDAELYRAWLVMAASAGLLLIADFGLHPFTYLRLQEQFANDDTADKDEVSKVVAGSRSAYAKVMFVFGIVLPLLAYLLPIEVLFGLSGATPQEFRTAFAIALFGGSMMIVFGYHSAVLRATDRLNTLSISRILVTAVQTAAICMAIWNDWGIVGVASMYAGTFFLLTLILEFSSSRTHNLLPGNWPNITPDKAQQSSFIGAKSYIVPSMSEIALQHIPIILMGVLRLPAIEIVAFTITRTLTSLVRQVTTFSTQPFAIDIGRQWTRGDREAAAGTILNCLAVGAAVSGPTIGFLLIYAGPLVNIWTEGLQQLDSVMLYLLLANLALAIPAMTAFSALMYTGQPSVITKAKAVQVVALIISTLALALYLGARGAALALVLAEVIATSIPLLIAMKRTFNVRYSAIAAATLVPFALLLGAAVLSGIFARQYVVPDDGLSFLLSAIVWLPVPLILFFTIFMYVTRKKSV